MSKAWIVAVVFGAQLGGASARADVAPPPEDPPKKQAKKKPKEDKPEKKKGPLPTSNDRVGTHAEVPQPPRVGREAAPVEGKIVEEPEGTHQETPKNKKKPPPKYGDPPKE